MRKLLLIIIVFTASMTLLSQEVATNSGSEESVKAVVEQKEPAKIKIFPVPVLEGRVTITSDIPFIYIRITNIIGQEIARERFYYPRYRTEVTFNNAEKGLYLVTIELEDNTKLVKKILVDPRQ